MFQDWAAANLRLLGGEVYVPNNYLQVCGVDANA